MKQTNTNSMKAAIVCTLLFLLATSNRIFSQVVYTDIPDVTPSATFPLDLNNDNLIDFMIQFDPGIKIMCKPQGSNAYSGNLSAGIYLPWALNSGVDICDSNITWYDSINPGTMAWGTSIGNWVGVTDKYLALKLIVGSNIYYGWVRLDVWATSTSFTVKDYAYESTPNNCIVTGQTTTSITEQINSQNLKIHPNPFYSSTKISINKDLINAKLIIYDSSNREVYNAFNITGNSIELSRGQLQDGIYFVVITENNRTISTAKISVINP